jgi:carbamoyl-phosphate synthase large subunit
VVAVTGLNATDNPGPGVAVIRCLRDDPSAAGRIVGLAYDSLEPGIHDPALADRVYLLPYPSSGREALLERLREILDETPIDVIVPTLDAELPAFVELSGALAELGVRMLLPTREQLDLRSKARIGELGERCGVPVPRTVVVGSVGELFPALEEVGLPAVVKGIYYGAQICRGPDEAVAALHRTAAQWGLPVLVQQHVTGEEYDVAALGDAAGRAVGAVPMKKLFLTDKGKGWAGVTVDDPELHGITSRILARLRWRGPCEVELIRDAEDGRYHLLEINPRFPAWIYLSAGAGRNLPAACVRLALGQEPAPMPRCRAGTMFVRIALDLIADFGDFQRIAVDGRLVRDRKEQP